MTYGLIKLNKKCIIEKFDKKQYDSKIQLQRYKNKHIRFAIISEVTKIEVLRFSVEDLSKDLYESNI